MYSWKFWSLLICAMALIAATKSEPEQMTGGVKQLSGDELKNAEKKLQNSLRKLAAGDGPNFRISKVLSATSQVVAGTMHKYETELIDENNDTKSCVISIWSRPWLDNGIQVTFDCVGQEKLVKTHSAAADDDD